MRNKIRTRSLICITALVITLLAIAGCSDMPYTGSMLTADDVDGYITSKDGETYCLVNGPDSACLTLTPTVEPQHANAPIIHIYPQKIVYVFYREGVPVLTAEKVVDTTEIVEKLTEPEPEPEPAPEPEPEPSDPDDRQTPESDPEFEHEPVPEPEPPTDLQDIQPPPPEETPVEDPPPPLEEPEPPADPEPEPPEEVESQPQPPVNTQPQPPRRANTGPKWLITVYYDDNVHGCDGNEDCAIAYIQDRYTLQQSEFKITINDDEITSNNIEGEVGVVSNEPPYRPGFQFVYRTPAASLDIQVMSPHSEVWQLKISGF